MRRLLSLVALSLLALVAPISGARAEPRVGPPLHVQLYLYINDTTDDPTRTASLDVSGVACVPNDAPASVIVTLDRLPGQVFTAKPTPRGRWFVSIDIPTPIDGVYVVNASCDNYFGTTDYPTATTNADEVIIARAAAGEAGGSSGGSTTPVPVPVDDGGLIANTGARTGSELGIGLGALALGLLLVLAGRPRRVARHIVATDVTGRHRRTD
jgi:hypothetical protein